MGLWRVAGQCPGDGDAPREQLHGGLRGREVWCKLGLGTLEGWEAMLEMGRGKFWLWGEFRRRAAMEL